MENQESIFARKPRAQKSAAEGIFAKEPKKVEEREGSIFAGEPRVKKVREVAEVEAVPARGRRRGSGVALALAILALLVAGGGGTLSLLMFLDKDKGSGGAYSDRGGSYYDGNSANFTEGSIADVASRVAPAVVSILTTSDMQDVFGRRATSSGAGTGMIVSKDGYVLTNKHVVADAKEVTVVMDDGEVYEDVEVVGVDPMNDVAYLKIDGVSDLPTVTLGDSKTVAVGQPVIAIGNALGQYANSITSGIVSGTGRSITASATDGSDAETLLDMIQTDAAINLGNSGGPLVNATGEVIGINTAVSSDGEGLGFAVPISSTKGMMRSVDEGGDAERAYLGVSYLAITPEVAKEYNLDVRSGAYIYTGGSGSAVSKGGPADKAGVRDGDIVLAVNGVKVGARGSITSLIGEYTAGERVRLSVLRDGREIEVEVELGAYPES